MSAKDMFEKLGYEYQVSYFEGKIDQILYIKNYKFASCVLFNLSSKSFKIYRFDDEYKSAWCDVDMFKAINQQCKEFGWHE